MPTQTLLLSLSLSHFNDRQHNETSRKWRRGSVLRGKAGKKIWISNEKIFMQIFPSFSLSQCFVHLQRWNNLFCSNLMDEGKFDVSRWWNWLGCNKNFAKTFENPFSLILNLFADWKLVEGGKFHILIRIS